MAKVIVKSPTDLAAGAFFALVGAACVFIARDYASGSASDMGPGYVIRILCWLLLIVGTILVVRSFALDGPDIGPLPLRAPVVIIASIVGFSLLVGKLGFVITGLLLIVVGSTAASDFRFREIIISAIVLTCLSVVVFKVIHGLPIQLWPGSF